MRKEKSTIHASTGSRSGKSLGQRFKDSCPAKRKSADDLAPTPEAPMRLHHKLAGIA